MRVCSKSTLQKAYVSELDVFLQKLDQNPQANSNARQLEISKYDRIRRLRDYSDQDAPKSS